MSEPAAHWNRVIGEFTTPTRGVLGLVDELLDAAAVRPVTLGWADGYCSIETPRSAPTDRVEIPARQSVVRAVVARLAVLCNERSPGSVTPSRGEGELGTGPAAEATVRFVNTPDECRAELAPVTAANRTISPLVEHTTDPYSTRTA